MGLIFSRQAYLDGFDNTDEYKEQSTLAPAMVSAQDQDFVSTIDV